MPKIKLFIALCLYCQLGFSQATTGGVVLERATKQPIVGATVTPENSKNILAITDIAGHFTLKNAAGKLIKISYLGYKPIVAKASANAVYYMVEDSNALGEVVVTAQESHGLASASTIRRHAMEHLQPSSFADLLELLPGGRASDPSLSTPNTIHLREVPIASSNYSTSSLGTQFVIDGAPISTNANMQYLTGAYDRQSTSRDFTNEGVDMRSISTDDIQDVEIVRGIPSAEYGDLTSGLVKIRRLKGGNNIVARFKADMDSKLFYLSKGMEWQDRRLSLNLSADYLDSKNDPRNLLETYKRLTFSARLNKQWLTDKWDADAGLNLDYGGSFDDDKVDPEINYGGVDRYKSEYNRYAANLSLNFSRRNRRSFFRRAEMVAAFSFEKDITERTRLVQLSGETPAATTMTDGESDAVLISPYTYTATQKVDGRPLNLYIKANATFSMPLKSISNLLLLGADFRLDKNMGDGQVFDQLHPLYPGVSGRPRKYSDVPASHELSFFAEERFGTNIGRNKLEIEAGVRAQTMLRLPDNRALSGKYYLDPRVNIGWTFPAIRMARRNMFFTIAGGIGQHTKFPTVDQLYPDKAYMDLTELNYYHPVKAYRRIYLQTYVIDPTNTQLKAARNLKWEVRTDVNWGGNRLTVTYFREDMKSGFRSMNSYSPYLYKEYITDGIDANKLTAPPDVATLPYNVHNSLRGHYIISNGSRTLKRGIEYTLSTIRFPIINTRLTINGAWFRTEYHNSLPIMYKPSRIIGGQEVEVVGIYKDDDGYIREMTNTNFTFDTDIPKLKLGFSVSAQCLWMTARQSMRKQNEPEQYMDSDGNLHPFTPADRTDSRLRLLIRDYNEAAFERETVPFSMNLNLKATKKLLNDKLMVALFVNKLWDAHPDYERRNFVIRRYVTPYFGLEMNVKI